MEDDVVAEAAVVVVAEDGSLVAEAEDDPRVAKGEDGPLVAEGDGDPLVAEGEGDAEGAVRHGLAVEAQAVTGLATTRWSLLTGGVRLAARWGCDGGSTSSWQCGNCSVGRLEPSRVATG